MICGFTARVRAKLDTVEARVHADAIRIRDDFPRVVASLEAALNEHVEAHLLHAGREAGDGRCEEINTGVTPDGHHEDHQGHEDHEALQKEN